MWTKYINFEVIIICFLSLIPWPGPSVFKISCSRENTRVVRKIVQTKWLPILEKYQVKIPLDCPFHPLRDIFSPQQSAKKQHRPSQWTCGFCGKSFFEEKHLDMHFESRHKSNINMAEDAVCLADYCDIMRCKVLVSKDSTLSSGDNNMMSTDIEIWREATAYRTALQPSGPRDLAKLPARNNFIPSILQLQSSKLLDDEHFKTAPISEHCDKLEKKIKDHASDDDDSDEINGDSAHQKSDDGDDTDDSDDGNQTSPCDGNLVDSSLPPVDRKQQRLSELQKMKANCKSEELDKLKDRCEILVRNCIVGTILQLSDEDFRNMEEEMNRAVCWYLTCDRYWEDGPIEQRAFPWGLVFVLVMVLSLGVCFCYYIIWILFDTEDHNSMPTSSSQHTSHSSPMHHHQHLNAIATTNYYQHPHHLQQLDGGVAGQSAVANQVNAIAGAAGAPSTSSSQGFAEEFYTAADFSEVGQSEHYIYVTYPPELKRRLLESCYNRTTRL